MADDVEYVQVEELLAYPGVAAPEATINLVVEIVNGMLNEILADATIDQDAIPWRIKAIALSVAASRVSGNADGAQQVTVQIDDYKETRIWPDGSATSGDISFTAKQIRAIRIAAGLAVAKQSTSIRLHVPHSVVCR